LALGVAGLDGAVRVGGTGDMLEQMVERTPRRDPFYTRPGRLAAARYSMSLFSQQEI
jgi:hypothetical protein